MAWTVQLAVAAEKTLSKLDPPVARRIVGDWRVICDLVDESSTITVIRIGHRSSVYRG